MNHHSVGVATVLSIILPGAGQFFNRQAAKGALLLLLSVVFLVIFAANPRAYGYMAWGTVVVWVVGMFDAGLVASRIVRHGRVSPWRWF